MDRLERDLERLKERHEALTQSIELMHNDWEGRWAKSEERWDKRFDRMMGAVESLVAIAESHERRLEGLEGH